MPIPGGSRSRARSGDTAGGRLPRSPRPRAPPGRAGTLARGLSRPARRPMPTRPSGRLRPARRPGARPRGAESSATKSNSGPSSGRARTQVRPSSCHVGTSPDGGRSTSGSGPWRCRSHDVPTRGWPARGSSTVGVKMRSRAPGAILDEDGLAEAEIGRYPLRIRALERRGIEEDTERVAAAAVGSDEHAHHVEESRPHAGQATRTLRRDGERRAHPRHPSRGRGACRRPGPLPRPRHERARPLSAARHAGPRGPARRGHAARAALAPARWRALVRRRAHRLSRSRHVPRHLPARRRMARRRAGRRRRSDRARDHRRLLPGCRHVVCAQPRRGAPVARRSRGSERLRSRPSRASSSTSRAAKAFRSRSATASTTRSSASSGDATRASG